MPSAAARTARRLLAATAVIAAAAAGAAVVWLPMADDGAGSDLPVPVAAAPSVSPERAEAVDLSATHPGFAYGTDVTSPTKDDPQSKLWYHDGAWWAVMVNPGTEKVHAFELQDDQAWRDTGTVIDERPASTADVLWDGVRLHVATRTSGGQVRFASFDYVPRARAYQMLPGHPVVVADGGATSVSLAQDSNGDPWMTFVQNEQVQVARGSGPDAGTWSPPGLLAGDAARVTGDDVSAITRLRDGVGVMWSNQRTGAFHFVTHRDGDDSWGPVETPVQGEHMADGHLQLVVRADGTAFAAVKTSMDDSSAADSAPLVLVLERSPDGAWTTHVAGTIGDKMTRPKLVLSESDNLLYLFFTAPAPGGRIHYKISPLDEPRWGSGRGPAVLSVPGGRLNNVTTTRQPVDGTSDLVLLVSDDVTHRYYHTTLQVGEVEAGAGVQPSEQAAAG